MKSVRLIVVDDHPIVRTGLQTLLTSQTDFELVGECRFGYFRQVSADIRTPRIVQPASLAERGVYPGRSGSVDPPSHLLAAHTTGGARRSIHRKDRTLVQTEQSDGQGVQRAANAQGFGVRIAHSGLQGLVSHGLLYGPRISAPFQAICCIAMS